MEIKINLDELVGSDEEGSGSIKEFILEEIRRKASSAVEKLLVGEIKSAIVTVCQEQIKILVAGHLEGMVHDTLHNPFCPKDSMGRLLPETTVRDEIIKLVQAQMVYKKTSYDSDKNAFTLQHERIVAAEFAKFKESFSKLVNETFTAQAMQHAAQTLKAKLGLS